MALGGTAKTLQKVVNVAENVYERMGEVLGRLEDLETTVKRTSEQVDNVERSLVEQRAILEAIAETEGLNIDSVLESANQTQVQRPLPEDTSVVDSSLSEEQASKTVRMPIDRSRDPETTDIDKEEMTINITVSVDEGAQSESDTHR